MESAFRIYSHKMAKMKNLIRRRRDEGFASVQVVSWVVTKKNTQVLYVISKTTATTFLLSHLLHGKLSRERILYAPKTRCSRDSP
jgi:hypothetical protein